jgi:hypothetical protein
MEDKFAVVSETSFGVIKKFSTLEEAEDFAYEMLDDGFNVLIMDLQTRKTIICI